uniref:Uncharacterized protein n=1 Tax=Knipowitschia caucasica TaxID=637954 RepID=A0AAV2K5C9_KNICA
MWTEAADATDATELHTHNLPLRPTLLECLDPGRHTLALMFKKISNYTTPSPDRADQQVVFRSTLPPPPLPANTTPPPPHTPPSPPGPPSHESTGPDDVSSATLGQ